MYEGKPNKKPNKEMSGGEDIKKTLREIAEMTQEERKEKRGAYLGSEIQHGKLKMTPEEIAAHRRMRERRRNLEKRP